MPKPGEAKKQVGKADDLDRYKRDEELDAKIGAAAGALSGVIATAFTTAIAGIKLKLKDVVTMVGGSAAAGATGAYVGAVITNYLVDEVKMKRQEAEKVAKALEEIDQKKMRDAVTDAVMSAPEAYD